MANTQYNSVSSAVLSKQPKLPLSVGGLFNQKQEVEYRELLRQSKISLQDCDFLLEKRKQDIYTDKVFVDCFTFIRKYDFLPKSVLTDCFSRSLKFVYDLKYQQEQYEKKREQEKIEEERLRAEVEASQDD